MASPRSVRNFHIRACVDGRESELSASPAGADGGIYVTIQVRERGQTSDKQIYISGHVEYDKEQRCDILLLDVSLADQYGRVGLAQVRTVR